MVSSSPDCNKIIYNCGNMNDSDDIVVTTKIVADSVGSTVEDDEQDIELEPSQLVVDNSSLIVDNNHNDSFNSLTSCQSLTLSSVTTTPGNGSFSSSASISVNVAEYYSYGHDQQDPQPYQQLPIMIEEPPSLSFSSLSSSLSSMMSTTSTTASTNNHSHMVVVQQHLRWGVDWKLAQRYCSRSYHKDYNDNKLDDRYGDRTHNNQNCHPNGESDNTNDNDSDHDSDYDDFCFEIQSTFEDDTVEILKKKHQVKFYDSVTGRLLFVVPKIGIQRTFEQFLDESVEHGFLLFRDSEVNWDYVRCVTSSGEMISLDGTRLGYHIPDQGQGNRYSINLLAVSGRPEGGSKKKKKSKKTKKYHPHQDHSPHPQHQRLRRGSLNGVLPSPKKAVKHLRKGPAGQAIRRMMDNLKLEVDNR